jgi:hypothetical protein
MKKINLFTTLLAISFALSTKGQYVPNPLTSKNSPSLSSGHSSLSGGINTFETRSDTTRVMILCSDTTVCSLTQFVIYSSKVDSMIDIGSSWQRVPYVFWKFGYVCYYRKSSFEYKVTFFDENKKPLKKELVVWQYLNIK